MDVSEHTIKTDVLVVGAGFAGCFAAIRAREMGAEVLIVDAGKAGFSGASAIGTHINRVVLPEDDHEAALKATVYDSDFMVDQEYAEGVIAESFDRFNQWLELGSNFIRTPTGEIEWVVGNTPNTFYQQRYAVWLPWNSYQHVTNVKNGALHLGASVLDWVVVTELLVSDGKVVGALGVNKRDGDYYIFKAKAVVMAAGTAGVSSGLTAANHASYTGDGIAMALRAGAELRGMEFSKADTLVATKIFDTRVEAFHSADIAAFSMREWDGSGNPEVEIVNAKGEKFLEKYERTYRRPDRFYPGPPYKRYIPPIWKEYVEGRGPCLQQMSRARKSMQGELAIGGHFISQSGGIRINPYGVCTIPGLFAGGIGSDMCCAPAYTIPANILGSQASGRRAGESAAQYSKEQSEPATDDGQIKQFKGDIYAPVNRDRGITEEEIRLKIIKAHAYLDLRNEDNLNEAYKKFRQIEQDVASLVADDPQELAKCLKVRNLVQELQATALAAKERRETRQEHFRHDYPFIDNKDWLKWVIITGTGDRMKATLEDIPFDKWKFRPEPERVDPFEPRKEG